MDWSKTAKRRDVALMLSILVVQLVLEGYGKIANSESAEFGGQLAFAVLWIAFGYVAFRQHGTTRRGVLTVTLLVAGGVLNGYALLASNPVLGNGVAEILEGTGALLYVSQMKPTRSQPFQRA